MLNGKGLPPISVRLAKLLNQNLGNKAILGGFVQLPNLNYDTYNVNNDLRENGCNFVN